MNANDPQTQSFQPPVEERLAKLTGFNNPPDLPATESNTDTSSRRTSPLLSDEDLEEQITRHSFASSPLSKLVFVAGAVFFVVFLASLFLSQFQSPGESVSANKPTAAKKDEQSPLLSPENKDKEKGELLSELALREQQERLRDLEAQKADQPKPVTVKQPEKPVVRTVPVRPTPVRQVFRQPPPRPQTIPVRYQLPVRPLPVYRPPAVSRPITSTTQQDPTQLWLQLAQVGSFGGSSVASSSPSNQKRLTPIYEAKTASKITTNRSQSSETPVPETNPVQNNDYRAISFGQSVSAVLATTISWEGSRGNRTTQPSEDRYLVTLNQPLKDKFGNLEIPAGSQLIVRLDSKSQALVTLTAESIMVDGVETSLPQGALKIRSLDGQPLIAQMTTLGGNDGNNGAEALADVLSIAGDFADIPGSRSFSTLYRTITGGGTRRSSSGNTATVFFLREGTSVEVFVNKSFSLDVPEKPLEIDLSAIELPDNPIALESTDTVGKDKP